MHRADLSERVVAIEREVVTDAKVTLERRRPGERTAECPARIRSSPTIKGPQLAEIDRCSVSPQEGRLLDQLAMISGASGLDAEPARDAGYEGSLNSAHPVVTAVEEYAQGDETRRTDGNLHMIPVLLVDRAIPLDAPVPPKRLPAQLVVDEGVGCEGQWRSPAAGV